MSDQISHGRGGVGNFSPDPTKYVDGSITRAGPEGDQGDGPYSTGRGGGANIGGKGSPIIKAADKDVVPQQAQRIEKLESHHVGRGGEGNVSHVHEQKRAEHEGKESEKGLADKLKNKLTGHKRE